MVSLLRAGVLTRSQVDILDYHFCYNVIPENREQLRDTLTLQIDSDTDWYFTNYEWEH